MIVGWETEGGGDEQRDSDEEWSIETSSGWVWQHPASTGDRGELLIFFWFLTKYDKLLRRSNPESIFPYLYRL